MKLLLTIAVSLTLGLWAGVQLEAHTQAYRISRITGTSYLQVLSPISRNVIAVLGGN